MSQVHYEASSSLVGLPYGAKGFLLNILFFDLDVAEKGWY